MQSKFPYCYFICCVFWWQTILETEKSELVLHLTGTHPDGQPLNVMFPFAVPTDLRSSSLLLVCWCVLLSGFIMSWFEYYIIKYCFPPSNYPDSSPSDMDHASDRHAEAVNPLGRWATWGVMVVLPLTGSSSWPTGSYLALSPSRSYKQGDKYESERFHPLL